MFIWQMIKRACKMSQPRINIIFAVTIILKRAAELSFMYYSPEVIILFHTGFYKSAFST